MKKAPRILFPVFLFLFLFLLAATLSAHASIYDFLVYIDSDNDESTGCSVVTSEGTFAGAESVLCTTVETDRGAAAVTGVDIRHCDSGTGVFGPPESTSAGGWTVGIGNGADGADVVETFANLESARFAPDIRFGVAAGETGGASVSDILFFLEGDAGNPIVFSREVPPVPTLTHYGALLLVFILGGAGWYFSRKTGRTTFRVLAICLTATAVAAAVAWAVCAPDGDPSDWAGASPLAVDNEDENGDGPDILRFYAKDSGDQTCFRIDARIFFHTPPVLDLDGSADDPGGDIHYETAFTENSGPTAIVDPANLSLTDPENAQIVSATVVLESRPDGESEILDAQATLAVAVSYDSSTGTLTLAGPGSLADFQQALRSVTYDNTKTNPTTEDRIVRFEAENQYGPSAPARTLLHVLHRNHTPSFDKGPDQTVDEDAGPQVVKAWAANIDDGDPGLDQTLSFILGSNTNESLFAAGPAVDPATGDLTYEPAADANGSATVEILLTDDGGVENGGQDTSASQTFVITVNPVNDPPSAEDDSATFDEDSSGNIIDALANDDCSPRPGRNSRDHLCRDPEPKWPRLRSGVGHENRIHARNRLFRRRNLHVHHRRRKRRLGHRDRDRDRLFPKRQPQRRRR